MEFQRESSLVIYGPEIVSYTTGSHSQVEFDFEKVWNFKKKTEDFDPYYLSFLHVHPPGIYSYSGQDLNCIKGLNLAFNCEVYFGIVVFDSFKSWIHTAWQYRGSMMKITPARALMEEHLSLLYFLSHLENISCHGS